MEIEKVNTQNERLAAIGVKSFDYILDDGNTRSQIDFQDLLTTIAVNRANAVEDEMTPLANMMRNRNQRLDKYGNLLAKLNKIDTSFATDAKGDTPSGEPLTADECKILAEIGYSVTTTTSGSYNPTKAETQMYLQATKSAIDGLNNRSQNDVTRLQSLVDKRDQTYTKAAEVQKDVTDSHGKLIAAYGS